MKLNKMTFKTIVIQFKGNDVKNEIYKLCLDNLNKQLAALDNNMMLNDIRLRLLEQLAIVENRQRMLYNANNDAEYEAFIRNGCNI